MDRLLDKEVFWIQYFAGPSRSVLRGQISPHAPDLGVATEKLTGTMNPGPVTRSDHQVLFASLGKHVEETRNLGFLFIRDNDVLIPARPKLIRPIMKTTDLACHVAIDELHKARELLRALWEEQHVGVIREKGVGADLHASVPLAPTQDPTDRRIALRRRAEEITTLNRTGGYFHQPPGDTSS